jgi:hypothetical protein
VRSIPTDSELYTEAPCPYPDGTVVRFIIAVRRQGWFVTANGRTLMWLKSFTRTGTYTVYGRGSGLTTFHSGV